MSSEFADTYYPSLKTETLSATIYNFTIALSLRIARGKECGVTAYNVRDLYTAPRLVSCYFYSQNGN